MFKSHMIKLRQVRRGALRAGAYFAVVCAASSALCIRYARAEVQSGALEIGRQMAALAMTQHHDVTSIILNGQRIEVGSTQSDAAPSEVLKRYEEYCHSNASPFLTERTPEDPPDAKKSGFLEVSSPDGDEGVVMCFVRDTTSEPSQSQAIKSFVDTGRLGAIGELRYAYVAKAPHGTLVLTAWTDGNFNIRDIAPASPDKDVAGSDFPDVPRPQRAVRVITTRAEGTPYAANAYRTPAKPEEVVSFYDAAMRERGWRTYNPELSGKHARAYFRDGVVVTLLAQPDTDSSTYVGLGMSGVAAEDRAPSVAQSP